MNSETMRNRRTRRTTVTLEADVADFIQEALQKDRTLKEKYLINRLLRAGMKVEANQPKQQFKIKPFESSLAENITPDDVERLLDEI